MTTPTPTLDATLGGTESNSYVTLAEADAYFAGTAFIGDWNNHTDPYKEVALIQATQWLNPLDWAGALCAMTQALNWPRKEATCGGRTADCTYIPTQVKQATYELAFKLIHDPDAITGGVKDGKNGEGPVRRNKLGDLEQEFFEPTDGNNTKISPKAPTVLQTYPWLVDILDCWLTNFGGTREIRLYRN